MGTDLESNGENMFLTCSTQTVGSKWCDFRVAFEKILRLLTDGGR